MVIARDLGREVAAIARQAVHSEARTSCSVGSGVRRMSATRRAGSTGAPAGARRSGVKGGDQERRARAPDPFGEALPGADRDMRAREDRQADRGVGDGAQLAAERGDGAVASAGAASIEHPPLHLPVVPGARRPGTEVPSDHHLLDVARVHAQRLGDERRVASPGHDVLSPDSTKAPIWRNFW